MKRFSVILVTIAMVFAIVLPALAASAPVPGDPKWDIKYANAESLEAGESLRQNANGDKIPSNAHAADFPGLYFYWNDKQKDPGVLLVKPEVFNLFADGKFTLTAKNSNAYWEYVIAPSENHLYDDGVYAYGIPRNVMYTDKKGKPAIDELKNINMVFIDGVYKSAYLELSKLWKTECGFEANEALTSQVNFPGYVIGTNEIKITNYSDAVFGKKITVSEYYDQGKFEYVSSKVDRENMTATLRDVIIGGVYKRVREVSLSATADSNHTVVFRNKELPPPPQNATITIKKVWELEDKEIEYSYGIVGPGDMKTEFEVLGNLYTYGEKIEVPAGEVNVAEIIANNDWHLKRLTVNDVEYYDLVPKEKDPLGERIQYIAEFVAVAGEHYEVVFTNYMYVPEGDEYYVSVVSGPDGFGEAVEDDATRWIGQMGFTGGTISDYWNYWVTNYGDDDKVFSEMQKIAENGKKVMTWVWDRPDTMVDQTQLGKESYTVSWDVPFKIEGTEIKKVSTLYFLADNAIVVYINGKYVAHSSAAWGTGKVFIDLATDLANGTLNFEDAASWVDYHDFRIYQRDISTGYLEPGDNTITIFASNEPGTPDPEWNPCGVLLAFEVYSK